MLAPGGWHQLRASFAAFHVGGTSHRSQKLVGERMGDGALGCVGHHGMPAIREPLELDQMCGKGCRDVGLALDRVDRIVKLLGMVNCTPDFGQHPQVINGASDLLVDIFGPERGRHARSAVGMATLPLGISVEIEAILELEA